MAVPNVELCMLQVLVGDVRNDRPWFINSYEGLNGGEVWTNMRVWMWARFGQLWGSGWGRGLDSYEGLDVGEVWTAMRVWMRARFGQLWGSGWGRGLDSYEGLDVGEVWTAMRVWMRARFGGSGYFYSEKNITWSRRGKTSLRGVRPTKTQSVLLSCRE